MEQYELVLKGRQRFNQQMLTLLHKFAEQQFKQTQTAQRMSDLLTQFLQAKQAPKQTRPTLLQFQKLTHEYTNANGAFAERIRQLADDSDLELFYKTHIEKLKMAQQAKIPFIDIANRELAVNSGQLELRNLQSTKYLCCGFAEALNQLNQQLTGYSKALDMQAQGIAENDGFLNVAADLDFLSLGQDIREVLGVEGATEMTRYDAAIVEQHSQQSPLSQQQKPKTQKKRREKNQESQNHVLKEPIHRLYPRELASAPPDYNFVLPQQNRITFETEYVISGPQGTRKVEKDQISNFLSAKHSPNQLQSFAQQTSPQKVQEAIWSQVQPGSNLVSQPSNPFSYTNGDVFFSNLPRQQVVQGETTNSEIQRQINELKRLEKQIGNGQPADGPRSLFNNLYTVQNLFNNISSFTQSNSNISNSGPDPLNIFEVNKFSQRAPDVQIPRHEVLQKQIKVRSDEVYESASVSKNTLQSQQQADNDLQQQIVHQGVSGEDSQPRREEPQINNINEDKQQNVQINHQNSTDSVSSTNPGKSRGAAKKPKQYFTPGELVKQTSKQKIANIDNLL